MNSNLNVEEITFPTPWGHIAAKTWGDKTSMPVLAIHGFGENAATFDHLIPLLPRGLFYICLDLPSHGRSSFFPRGVTLDFLGCLREIHRILHEHLQYTKCMLLSHSAGGHFSLFLASLYPELVTKVVLLDIFPFFLIINNKDVCDSLRYNLQRSFELDKNNFVKHQFSSVDKLQDIFMKKHFTPISKKSAKTLLQRENYISNNCDNNKNITIHSDNRKELLIFPMMTLDFHLSVIKKIKTPVLTVISSECKEILTNEIPMSSTSIDIMRQSLGPLFKMEYVEGNHSVHLEHPERIASLISAFLTSDFCLL